MKVEASMDGVDDLIRPRSCMIYGNADCIFSILRLDICARFQVSGSLINASNRPVWADVRIAKIERMLPII